MKKPVRKDYEFHPLQEYIEALEHYIEYLESNTSLERGMVINGIGEISGVALMGAGVGKTVLSKVLFNISESLPDHIILADENGTICISPKNNGVPDNIVIGSGGLEFKPKLMMQELKIHSEHIGSDDVIVDQGNNSVYIPKRNPKKKGRK